MGTSTLCRDMEPTPQMWACIMSKVDIYEQALEAAFLRHLQVQLLGQVKFTLIKTSIYCLCHLKKSSFILTSYVW